MVFVAAFEFSYGPILWLYLAEICTEKGISTGILANWTTGLIVSQITPYLLTWAANYTFFIFGCFCFMTLMFVILFMRETKGLAESECKLLYCPHHHMSTKDT